LEMGCFYMVRAEVSSGTKSVERHFCTGGCEERTRAREAEESLQLEAVCQETAVEDITGCKKT
jgi:hypothetical protein